MTAKTSPLDTRPESVALVALGPSNRDFVHEWAKKNKFRRTDEVWVVNSGYGPFRCDKAWIMDDLRRVAQRFPKWAEEFKTIDVPIITCRSYPEYPTSVEFPLEAVKECLHDDLFTTTVAYAIAYATYIKVKELYLYGCDYWYPHSAAVEPGIGEVSFLLGVARERGMKFFIPQSSTLLNAFMVRFDKKTKNIGRPLYGYDYNPGDSCMKIQEGKGDQTDELAAQLSPYVRANFAKAHTPADGEDKSGELPLGIKKVQMDEQAKQERQAKELQKDMEAENAPVP